MNYTKLFSSLVHSTIWREPNHVRLVWITMLALADRDGIVMVSVPGLADVSRVSIEECKDALGRLQAPDPDSRSKVEEGRRVREVDGGFEVINHGYYRDLMSAEDRRVRAAERQRRKRIRDRQRVTPRHAVSQDVTDGNASNDTRPDQTRPEEDPTCSPPKRTRRKRKAPLPDDWTPTDAHTAKARELGVTLTVEAEKFRNHAAANDRRQVDWNRAFTNWLIQSAEYAGNRSGGGNSGGRASAPVSSWNIADYMSAPKP